MCRSYSIPGQVDEPLFQSHFRGSETPFGTGPSSGGTSAVATNMRRIDEGGAWEHSRKATKSRKVAGGPKVQSAAIGNSGSCQSVARPSADGVSIAGPPGVARQVGAGGKPPALLRQRSNTYPNPPGPPRRAEAGAEPSPTPRHPPGRGDHGGDGRYHRRETARPRPPTPQRPRR